VTGSLCGLRLGLLLRPDWLESYAEGIPGFDGIGGAEAQARRCFKQFLLADMNSCGARVLLEGGPGYMLSSLMSPSSLTLQNPIWENGRYTLPLLSYLQLRSILFLCSYCDLTNY
jgi:hypothetical protein